MGVGGCRVRAWVSGLGLMGLGGFGQQGKERASGQRRPREERGGSSASGGQGREREFRVVGAGLWPAAAKERGGAAKKSKRERERREGGGGGFNREREREVIFGLVIIRVSYFFLIFGFGLMAEFCLYIYLQRLNFLELLVRNLNKIKTSKL